MWNALAPQHPTSVNQALSEGRQGWGQFVDGKTPAGARWPMGGGAQVGGPLPKKEGRIHQGVPGPCPLPTPTPPAETQALSSELPQAQVWAQAGAHR